MSPSPLVLQAAAHCTDRVATRAPGVLKSGVKPHQTSSAVKSPASSGQVKSSLAFALPVP